MTRTGPGSPAGHSRSHSHHRFDLWTRTDSSLACSRRTSLFELGDPTLACFGAWERYPTSALECQQQDLNTRAELHGLLACQASRSRLGRIRALPLAWFDPRHFGSIASGFPAQQCAKSNGDVWSSMPIRGSPVGISEIQPLMCPFRF